MSHEIHDNIAVGVDLGSAHISVAAAMPIEEDSSLRQEYGAFPCEKLRILGATRVPCAGLKKGTIVNFDAVVTALRDAADEVEHQSGIDISTIRLGVSGTQVLSDNITETLVLKTNEVRQTDIDRLFQAVRTRKAPDEHDYIHIMPTHFILDGKPGIVDPIGMWGKEISCVFHRVSYPQSDLRNLVRACNSAGLRVQSVVFESLSSAESVLTTDEKDLGVCCLALGSMLTHVAVYSGGVPIFTKDYPFGAHHVTKDLSIGLRTTQAEAERIKRDFGHAVCERDADDIVTVTNMDSRSTRNITRQEISAIIEPRIREILESISSDLKRLKLTAHLTKGIVLTGGGAHLNGICFAAEEVFELSARTGIPLDISGSIEGLRSPCSAAVVGLLKRRFADFDAGVALGRASEPEQPQRFGAIAKRVWQRALDTFN